MLRLCRRRVDTESDGRSGWMHWERADRTGASYLLGAVHSKLILLAHRHAQSPLDQCARARARQTLVRCSPGHKRRDLRTCRLYQPSIAFPSGGRPATQTSGVLLTSSITQRLPRFLARPAGPALVSVDVVTGARVVLTAEQTHESGFVEVSADVCGSVVYARQKHQGRDLGEALARQRTSRTPAGIRPRGLNATPSSRA